VGKIYLVSDYAGGVGLFCQCSLYNSSSLIFTEDEMGGAYSTNGEEEKRI
jgi:hypothetical protein